MITSQGQGEDRGREDEDLDRRLALRRPGRRQDGKVLFAAGDVPTYAQIEALDVFVKGVVGDIPKS